MEQVGQVYCETSRNRYLDPRISNSWCYYMVNELRLRGPDPPQTPLVKGCLQVKLSADRVLSQGVVMT